jgi:Asp/Glu/hydantoin racemase
VGILEASICAALLLLEPGEHWGIVSTGKAWEKLLGDGVRTFLGYDSKASGDFAGVATTGLTATELHDRPADEVDERIVAATRALVRRTSERRVGVVCLGCAGMVGMEKTVRRACVEELGERIGKKVRIVDGVKAGLGMLEGLILSDI